jgi:ribosomal protein S18 acetylase RimI-like enzyme
MSTTIYSSNLSKLSLNDQNRIKQLCFICFSKNNDMLLLKKSHYLIVKNNNNIIGFVEVLPNKYLIQYLKQNNNLDMFGYEIRGMDGLFVYNLCVHPNYRKNNVGKTLIQNIINFGKLNKYKYAHCHIYSNNKSSLISFKKNKFIIDQSFIESDTKKEVQVLSRWI